MKIFKSILIALLIFQISCVNEKVIFTPKWIQGTWNNDYESNMNQFEFWTFLNDGISVTKGNPLNNPTIKDFNKLYCDYKHTINISDSLYKVTFSKKNEIITYEFRLMSLDFSDEPHISYSIKTESKIKRKQSNSVNCLLKKI